MDVAFKTHRNRKNTEDSFDKTRARHFFSRSLGIEIIHMNIVKKSYQPGLLPSHDAFYIPEILRNEF